MPAIALEIMAYIFMIALLVSQSQCRTDSAFCLARDLLIQEFKDMNPLLL